MGTSQSVRYHSQRMKTITANQSENLVPRMNTKSLTNVGNCAMLKKKNKRHRKVRAQNTAVSVCGSTMCDRYGKEAFGGQEHEKNNG